MSKTQHAFWGDDPSGICFCPDCEWPDEDDSDTDDDDSDTDEEYDAATADPNNYDSIRAEVEGI